MAINGFKILAERLDPASQQALVDGVMSSAHLYRPITPGGKPMSVEMSNMGPLGWVTDARGYRYEALHPVSGDPWPPIPASASAMPWAASSCPA